MLCIFANSNSFKRNQESKGISKNDLCRLIGCVPCSSVAPPSRKNISPVWAKLYTSCSMYTNVQIFFSLPYDLPSSKKIWLGVLQSEVHIFQSKLYIIYSSRLSYLVNWQFARQTHFPNLKYQLICYKVKIDDKSQTMFGINQSRWFHTRGG